MVAPLSLVFMCNLTFLVITVVSIHRVNTLMTFDAIDAMKKEQYQNLILYVKLSSVTSVYWIATIVAEAVDSDVLRWDLKSRENKIINIYNVLDIYKNLTCNTIFWRHPNIRSHGVNSFEAVRNKICYWTSEESECCIKRKCRYLKYVLI